MPTSTTSGRRVPGRPLKSPLAVASDYARPSTAGVADGETPVVQGVVLTDRETTLAEFEDYLRTMNNRDGRPYEEKTINAYVAPGKNLDAWLTANGIDGDFTAADTTLLNRYFREYYLEHGQGGTHTLQRNLIQLFNFLARERDHPTPYTDGLNRYAEVKGHPKTLGAEFIEDLLEVTGGGKARDFETAAAANAIDTFDVTAVYQSVDPANPWAVFNGYLDGVAAQATSAVVPRWTSRLGGADVYTQANAYELIESLRIDYGHLGPFGIHP